MQNDKIKQLELEGQRLRLELERYKVGIFFCFAVKLCTKFFFKRCVIFFHQYLTGHFF